MGGAVNKVVEVGSLGLIKDATGSEAAASAAKKAAGTQAAYQQRALDYLMQSEKIPQELRESALTRLGAMFGVPRMDEEGEPLGGDPLATQAQRIEAAKASPLYQEILGGQKAGEESLMRQAGMTGGLRSGNIQSALYDYSTQLQNKALTDAYNQQISEENRILQGLSGLGNLPSLTTGIAQQTAGIGQTLAQGQIGAAQSAQAADQAMIGNAMQAAAIASMFSDERLKRGIEHIGQKNGFNWYRWKWNDKAAALGLTGEAEGVIAQEVRKILPEAVREQHGYLHVDYNLILKGAA
jgi:hypothetical protein